MSAPSDDAPSRLARRLGLGDAVVIGLGSMIGAGVFAAIGPAAGAAGSGLLLGLAIAAAVAYCNATSSAALAAVYPTSGGTYVYGRERLGPFWGYLAGWGFVVGKAASCAAMALTVGAYAAPTWQRPIAVTAVAGLTAVNYLGIRKTAILTRVIVTVVLAALALVVTGALFGGTASVDHFNHPTTEGVGGILRSAGLLFFAFAGYARIATLGEEVQEPAYTIPKAIPRALGITLVVYATVAISALAAVGPAALSQSDAPLATTVSAGNLGGLVPAVRVGATVAALGVLLSLIAGVSRTAFAMAADREFPGWLDAVHHTHAVPYRAELAAGALIALLVAFIDLRGAIGFSSVCVLTYYAITNASAWTLPPDQQRWPRPVAALGVVGCATLVVTLPIATVAAGTGVLVVGAAVWAVRHRTP
ncbi:MAG: APC family permease [Acidimicrobiales bacterium]|nr:APC family permease [Acidimicrobiales bacterium]